MLKLTTNDLFEFIGLHTAEYGEPNMAFLNAEDMSEILHDMDIFDNPKKSILYPSVLMTRRGTVWLITPGKKPILYSVKNSMPE